MNADEFRRIALGQKDASERAHMGHPDFRVNGRIFATLHAGLQTGMVKLTPEEQQEFIARNPAAFSPASGAWGRGGSTVVTLNAVDHETLGEAMTLAWRACAATPARPSRPARQVAARKGGGSRRR